MSIMKIKDGDGNWISIPTINGKDGISVTHFWEDTTLIITSASGTSSVDLKGDKGDKGDNAITDQTYNAESENAQSGKAVAEAIKDKPTVHEGKLLTPYDLAMGSYSSTEELFKVGDIYINIDNYKIYQIVNVISSTDSYTYLYKILTQDIDQSYNPNSSNAQSGKAVAEAIGNIETVLDGIITIQNELIGGVGK